MAHTPEQILKLLPLLDEQRADDLESDTLDFKECPTEGKLRELSREMATRLGNAPGGTVVFGVREKAVGVDRAVVGVDFARVLVEEGLFPSLTSATGLTYNGVSHCCWNFEVERAGRGPESGLLTSRRDESCIPL